MSFTLGGFATRLLEMEVDIKSAEEAILEKVARLVEKRAKKAIGTYDFGWTPLAESTKADRERQGYAADKPLLRTGELRDSIGHVTTRENGQAVAYIGTSDPIAKFQELGTSKIPPRSFLAAAAMQSEQEVHRMIERAIIGALSSRESHEWREILHLFREIGHDVKEATDDVRGKDGDDGEKR